MPHSGPPHPSPGPPPSPLNDSPVTLDAVLAAECAVLRPPGAPATPLRALCISGGGIRSATFSLGVVQRLAAQGLLSQFDYLSTVSGGGYLGAWLTAWKQRAGGLDPILPALAPEAPPPTSALDPVGHLRAYNNYLTPRLGALSADTWTVGVTIARNILLNWLVFLPLLLAALLLPRLWMALGLSLLQAPPAWISALPWVAGALLAVALFFMLRYLPGVGGVNNGPRAFVVAVLAPVVAAAALLAIFEWFRVITLPAALGGCLEASLAAWAAYFLLFGLRRGQRGELFAMLGAVIVLGLGSGFASWLLQAQTVARGWPERATVGVPLLLLGFSLAGCIFVGLSSHRLGTLDREWLARADAYLLRIVAIWLAVCLVVLLIPAWLLGHPWQKFSLATLGGAAAWLGSHLGYLAPANGKGSSPLRAWALKLAPAAFLTVVAIALAILTDWLLASTAGITAPWWAHRDLLAQTSFSLAVAWTVALLVLAWFMGRFININKFSLQGMYRDRLIRAYLGASTPSTDSNRFTGFSSDDDLAMGDLDPALRPFPVVNMTLNLVTGERLAWQQRKAESFTASPLHCGSAGLGYRPAARYGGEGGITLGTAIAISGAAASPNMGYHSSPAVGFLMTLFNLRLGAWLGNPGPAGDRTWRQAGPHRAASALMHEALGQTTDKSPYVYLSDGGHFENLALYEMVRRRCRSIVVVDAGCDPDFAYADLGNALRKIRIDLGVPIEFDPPPESDPPPLHRRWAHARILYSRSPLAGAASDAGDAASEDGELLYLKPVVEGREPPDVESYHAEHPDFPHESTADQWFSESQTESYRMLGDFTIAELCDGWPGGSLENWIALRRPTPPPAARQAGA